MNICMLAYSFYESDNRVRRYAESLVRRGDTVDVIALAAPAASREQVIQGVRVFNIQRRLINEKNRFDYLFRVLWFLIRHKHSSSRV